MDGVEGVSPAVFLGIAAAALAIAQVLANLALRLVDVKLGNGTVKPKVAEDVLTLMEDIADSQREIAISAKEITKGTRELVHSHRGTDTDGRPLSAEAMSSVPWYCHAREIVTKLDREKV